MREIFKTFKHVPHMRSLTQIVKVVNPNFDTVRVTKPVEIPTQENLSDYIPTTALSSTHVDDRKPTSSSFQMDDARKRIRRINN